LNTVIACVFSALARIACNSGQIRVKWGV
jgi:hypothetical protein